MKEIASLPPTVSALRERHPRLRYRGYSMQRSAGLLRIDYDFLLEPEIAFTPRIIIPTERTHSTAIAERLAFLIGMAELISYWKLACPEIISVECGHLKTEERQWWETLFRHGLGEFFYLNQISPRIDFSFISTAKTSKEEIAPRPVAAHKNNCLILVGGGKDSIVSLELIKRSPLSKSGRVRALCVNPIPASLEAIAAAGIDAPLVVTRQIDARLRQMNTEGYLNGHTPYSALLAFIATLAAEENGFDFTISSNETSASEGNASIDGIEVNHQYSKSYHFENAFRDYLRTQQIDISYFSFLRPLNELQICSLFSALTNYHSIFRSCNREQTAAAKLTHTGSPRADGRREGWCGECPKCLFTYICLACFLPLADVDRIFGTSPLSSPHFFDIAKDLAGAGIHKPFECVGTYTEVQSALSVLHRKVVREQPQYTEVIQKVFDVLPASPIPLAELLASWDAKNFLTVEFENVLRDAMRDSGRDS